ncbi:MAG: JAB domain-containing protein [Chloroflexota bacterium]|nr:JAB domain-containing protein [Chloroflexota bacterium]
MANPGKVAAVVRDYLADVDREHFVVLLLDAKSRIIGINTVAVGTLDGAPVHPREVFKAAVLANAACVIVAHNHPSGDPTPSPQDRAVTRLLQRAGDAMRIPVLDHVIVTADGASFSFATEAQAAGAVA